MKKLKEKWESNEFVILFKTIWANKRYRSLALLGCYFIFFLFLGIAFRTVPSTQNDLGTSNKQIYEEADVKQLLQDKASNDYSYTMIINDVSIEGKVSEGTNSFFYEDNQYVIIYNKLYQNQDGNLMLVDNFLNTLIPFDNINLANINDKLKEKVPVKENLTEDSFELSYQVLSSEFIENDNSIITIKIKGKEEKIEKIELLYQTDSYILKIKE